MNSTRHILFGTAALTFLLSACAEFPEVDAVLADGNAASEPPPLLPIDDLLDADDPKLEETDSEALRNRADALRNRADGLRRPVIDDQTRTRMEAGVTEP